MSVQFDDNAPDLRELLPPEIGQKLRTEQLVFLTAYIETGNLSEAARATGQHRGRHYVWVKTCPAYAEALYIIEVLVTDRLAEALHQRGFVGVRRYKFTRDGQPIMWTPPGKDKEEHYYELEWSDQLLLRLLEARDPKRFSAKVKNDHSGELHITRVVLDRGRGSAAEGDPNG